MRGFHERLGQHSDYLTLKILVGGALIARLLT
jgi:hypothetical protein